MKCVVCRTDLGEDPDYNICSLVCYDIAKTRKEYFESDFYNEKEVN